MIPKIYHILFFFVIALNYSNVAKSQTLTKYVKQKQQEIAEMQRIEKQKYDYACQKGTLEAFKEYARIYPNGKYIEDINKRIEDFSLWSKASSENTIDAYKQYLQKSKYRNFQTKADVAINELQSVEEWNRIKNSHFVSDIEHFISSYPNSPCIADARKRIHELEAVVLYNSGDLLNAFHKFNEAGGLSSLQDTNYVLYDKCKEYYDYSLLSSSPTEDDLELFLMTYPNSQYSNNVSNKLAIFKAKRLSMFSTNDSFNSVLNYAKDEPTRAIVKHYIDNCKKYKRRNRIKANGGYILFGIEMLDFGWNCLSSDRLLEIGYYNIGFSVRLGNYRAPVQFEIGVKPGLLFYYLNDEYVYLSQRKFHLPVYAKLKVNLFNVMNSKFYMAGLGYYNAIGEGIENKFSVGGGFGFAWRNWDWMVYYKQDIDNKLYSDDKYVETSLINSVLNSYGELYSDDKYLGISLVYYF